MANTPCAAKEQLFRTAPEDFPAFLARNEKEMIQSRHPWSDYMRERFREHGILQQNVFLAADLSEKYGYKLIGEEKHTSRRDTMIIPAQTEPPVRTLRATIPENESH